MQPIPTYSRGNLLLSMKNIALSYKGFPVLAGVNGDIFDLHEDGQTRGQVVGLLGPSGVGKTQLLKILSGMQRSEYTGEVLISEKQLPIKRGQVGVVAQSYPLFEHRTLLGNMLVAVPAKDRANAHEVAMTMLRAYDLEKEWDKYPYQLSGGQRQRAATAQQMLCSSHFLIMDEPFSGQDPVRVKNACKFITDVASRDTLNTIVLVSQTISPVVVVADMVWLLGRARAADGSIIPGAFIKKEINLIDRGLAWQPDVKRLPEFVETVREIEAEFDFL